MTASLTGKVLVCIPTYNERDSIAKVLSGVLSKLPDAHILVVDDRSPDGTGKVVSEITRTDQRVHLLSRPRKTGIGSAYRDAFSWGLTRDYDVLIQFDGDGSHDPDYLQDMMVLLQDAAFVTGSRCVQGGGCSEWSRSRRFLSMLGNAVARIALRMSLQDLTSGFNGIRRDVLSGIDLDRMYANGYGFQIELKYRTWRNGFDIQEMPIQFRPRQTGQSKLSTRIVFEALFMVFHLRWNS